MNPKKALLLLVTLIFFVTRSAQGQELFNLIAAPSETLAVGDTVKVRIEKNKFVLNSRAISASWTFADGIGIQHVYPLSDAILKNGDEGYKLTLIPTYEMLGREVVWSFLFNCVVRIASQDHEIITQKIIKAFVLPPDFVWGASEDPLVVKTIISSDTLVVAPELPLGMTLIWIEYFSNHDGQESYEIKSGNSLFFKRRLWGNTKIKVRWKAMSSSHFFSGESNFP